MQNNCCAACVIEGLGVAMLKVRTWYLVPTDRFLKRDTINMTHLNGVQYASISS